MKYLIYFAFLLGYAQFATAQDTESAQKTRNFLPRGSWGFEVGINATKPLFMLVKKAPDSSNINPYLLQMRLSKGNWGIHMAAGGRNRNSYNSVEGFADSDERIQRSLDLRAGLDFRQSLGRGFTALFGLDYVHSYNNDCRLVDSGYDISEEIDQSDFRGVGFNTGLSYWITPKLAISTEANFQWLAGYRDRARRFKNFPELDDKLLYEQTDILRTSVLGGVFLTWRF